MWVKRIATTNMTHSFVSWPGILDISKYRYATNTVIEIVLDADFKDFMTNIRSFVWLISSLHMRQFITPRQMVINLLLRCRKVEQGRQIQGLGRSRTNLVLISIVNLPWQQHIKCERK